MENQLVALTPYENFLFALKAKESKRQYPHRLDKFLVFMELKGTMQKIDCFIWAHTQKSILRRIPKLRRRYFFCAKIACGVLPPLTNLCFFKLIGEEGICPMCYQDQLSSFPLMSDDSFTYRYSEKKGIEIKFSNGKAIKQISQIETPW